MFQIAIPLTIETYAYTYIRLFFVRVLEVFKELPPLCVNEAAAQKRGTVVFRIGRMFTC